MQEIDSFGMDGKKDFHHSKCFIVDRSDKFSHISTSKGNQAKWCFGNTFIKADSMGYEGLAEVIVSGLCEYSNLDYVKYEECVIRDGSRRSVGCCCQSFLKDESYVVSFAHILEQELGEDFSRHLGKGFKEDFKFVCGVIHDVAGISVEQYVADCLFLDAVILNEDRHFNNLCLMCASGKYCVTPVFDNGLSLLSDLGAYDFYSDFIAQTKRVRAKPFVRDFGRQVRYLRELGFEPLRLKSAHIYAFLDHFQSELYSSDQITRCKAVVRRRMRMLEGKAWIEY